MVGQMFHGGLRDISWAQRNYPFVDLQMMLAWSLYRKTLAEEAAERKSPRKGVSEFDRIKSARRGGGVMQVDQTQTVMDFDDITQFARSFHRKE